MTCYVVNPRPASHDGFKTWVMMGYTGSYEQYVAHLHESPRSSMFICGDLGAHCTECAAPHEFLCDYPVGDDKTCDRPLCADHANEVAIDVHYCRGHFIQWREYLASARGYEVLDNVTPLGVTASRIEARSDETRNEVRPEGQEPDPKGDAQ